jgi:hypothetical protein
MKTKKILIKISISSGSVFLYILLFYIFESLGTIWLSALVLIPVAAFSFFFGLKGGLALGILSYPLSRLLFLLFHRSPLTGSIDIAMGVTVSVFFGVLVGYLRDLMHKYKGASENLARAISEVKKLSGLLPMCANCKKIRNDEGYWQQVEDYITKHTEAEFSHGLCPDCAKKLYPELAMKKNTSSEAK